MPHNNKHHMQTIIQQEAVYNAENTADRTMNARTGIVSRFLHWSAKQERNRFGWLALILTSHGCVLTPLTLFAVILSGSSLALFIAAVGAMGLVLVTNLAAMPTRVTIPAFFLSIVIDVAIVVICAISGFNVAGAGL